MSKNILFITESLFTERTGASIAIDGKQIFPMIKVAQDIYIQPVLGSTLYKRLQDGIDQDTLTNDEKNLLDFYITDTLIWYTMSMLPMVMGYQLFSKGFLNKTSEGSNTPSRSDYELIEQKYKSMAEFYSARLIGYLQQNYTKFYEYLNPELGVDVIFPKTDAYTCPIYIGDTRERTMYLNNSTSYVPPTTVYYTAQGSISTFNVPELVGRTIIAAFRSGLNKIITEGATSDTGYIQIYSGQVTLPTGDLTIPGELFTFLYR